MPGTNLELIYATVEIAPGFKAGRHSHPGIVCPGRRRRISGRPDGQPEKVFKPGESSEIPDRAIHNEGAEAPKISVVYAVEKGKPLASPAK